MIDVQSVSLGKFEPRGISLKRNQIKQFVLTWGRGPCHLSEPAPCTNSLTKPHTGSHSHAGPM